MKPSTLQQKASRPLALDSRRKAHHAALSSLHDTLLPSLEEHEARDIFRMNLANIVRHAKKEREE